MAVSGIATVSLPATAITMMAGSCEVRDCPSMVALMVVGVPAAVPVKSAS